MEYYTSLSTERKEQNTVNTMLSLLFSLRVNAHTRILSNAHARTGTAPGEANWGDRGPGQEGDPTVTVCPLVPLESVAEHVLLPIHK